MQLQGLEKTGALDRLARARVDMLVLEPMRSIRGSEQFAMRALVARIHAGRGSSRTSRLCLAYMNIGQAEDYRCYWQSSWKAPTKESVGSPKFLVAVDPDGWEGNYPVAFWTRRWKRVLFGSPNALLDQILADGFDGAYLDWVLGYAEPRVVAAAKAAHVDPVAEMITLLGELRTYARARNPEFQLIAQNGADLPRRSKRFLDVIDGFAHEDLSFRGEAGVAWDDPQAGGIPRLDPGERDELPGLLAQFRDRAIPVFTLDYAITPNDVRAAFAKSRRLGFIPCVTRTPLDRLPTPLTDRRR